MTKIKVFFLKKNNILFIHPIKEFSGSLKSLEQYLKGKYGTQVELISSGGGVFEVRLDEKLIFSKKSLGRFPEHSEIDDLINNNIV